jgi:hypothetical protein
MQQMMSSFGLTITQVSSPGLTGRSSIPEAAMGTRSYYVYMFASRIGGTHYIKVTNDLVRRVYADCRRMTIGRHSTGRLLE